MSLLPRRPLLLQPGQSLLLAPDTLRAALDFAVFSDFTGIPANRLVASRMSPVPIPVASGRPPEPRANRSADRSADHRADHTADHRAGRSLPRASEVRPEAMWMPLLWLPPRLENRYTFQIIEGEVSVRTKRTGIRPGYAVYTETDDLWAIRIALELGASGIYDETSGTWLDVMALLDIDVDDPGDVARIAAWLDGGSDADLDLLDSGLEIGSLIVNPDNPHWALESALTMFDSLLECTWALGADSLLGATDDLVIDAADTLPEGKSRYIMEMICLMGRTWLAGASIPGEPLNEDDWWADVSLRLERGGKVEVLLPDLVEHLSLVREHYWVRMEQSAHSHQEALVGS